MVVHFSHPTNSRKPNRRVTLHADVGKKQDLISKITRAKRIGGLEEWPVARAPTLASMKPWGTYFPLRYRTG
jgi:hypothetical protein